MNPLISTPPGRWEKQAPKIVLLAGFLIGVVSFSYYFLHGLSMAHYDAKAHLLVARRMVDSTTPGYAQMGAHWLPLIHLLYLPFVLMDSQYRSALIPSLLSVCAFALSGWLVYRIAARLTGSVAAGLFAASVLLANANLQFLQSAPLTEPVYMVLSLLALDSLLRWREGGGTSIPRLPALWAALGALCRYEGWLFVAGVIGLLAYDLWRGNLPRKAAIRAMMAYCGIFAVPALAHFGYIYLQLGDTFFQRVVRGNPAPYETFHRPLASVLYHVSELAQAAAVIPLLIGLAGVGYAFSQRERLRGCRYYFLLWLPSVMNILALWWGLMYRVRYSALLIPAIAVFGSLLVSRDRLARRVIILSSLTVFLLPWISWIFPKRWEYHLMYPGPGLLLLPAAALILVLAGLSRERFRMPLLILAVLSMQIPVLEGESGPMLSEAMEHQYIEPERQQILKYLAARYDGSRIMIDVGRLAPLMYDSGLPVGEFICHDGDVVEWKQAISAPRRYAGWLCAEKGDEVWTLLAIDPHWADGYSLAVSTDNYVLYHLDSGDRSPQSPIGPVK